MPPKNGDKGPPAAAAAGDELEEEEIKLDESETDSSEDEKNEKKSKNGSETGSETGSEKGDESGEEEATQKPVVDVEKAVIDAIKSAATRGQSSAMPVESVNQLIAALQDLGDSAADDDVMSLPRKVITVMKYIKLSFEANKEKATETQKNDFDMYKLLLKKIENENKPVFEEIKEFLKVVKQHKKDFSIFEGLSTREVIFDFLAKIKNKILSLLKRESAEAIFKSIKSFFTSLAQGIRKYSTHIFSVVALGLIICLAAYAGLLSDKETRDLAAVKDNEKKLLSAFNMTMKELNDMTETSNVKYITVMETFTHIFDRVGVDVVHPVMNHLHDVSDELRQLTIVAAKKEIQQKGKQFTSKQAKNDEIARVSEKIMRGMSTVLASGNEKALHVFFERLFEPVQHQKDAEHEQSHWSFFPHDHEKEKHDKDKKKGFFA